MKRSTMCSCVSVLLATIVLASCVAISTQQKPIAEIDAEEARSLLYQSVFTKETEDSFQAICNDLVRAAGVKQLAANRSDQNQSNILRVLKAVAGPDNFRVRIHKGAVRRLDLDLKVPKSYLTPGASRDDVALAVLREWHGLLRVQAPEHNLRMVRRTGFNERTLSFRQYYNDIPVYGSWVQITIDDENDAFLLKRLAGRYIPDLALDQLEPLVPDHEATRKVMQEYGVKSPSDLRVLVPVKLWIYDKALTAPTCPQCPKEEHNPRLAWRVVFHSPKDAGAVTDAFVDVLTGEMIYSQPRLYEQSDLRIASAQNNVVDFCTPRWSLVDPWFDEDGVCRLRLFRCSGNACFWGHPICAAPDAEGNDSNSFARSVYEFFDSAFQPVSDEIFGSIGDVDFITEGETFLLLLDACETAAGCPMGNAFSTSCAFWNSHAFGDGMLTLDVLAHEVGHTYHRTHVDFIYQDESGAIAEHVADMIAHFACCWIGDDCDWMQGEHSVLGPPAACSSATWRDLENPTPCNMPDHFNNGPGHMYVITAADHGGVHTNVAIPNKAGHLMVEGGVHPPGVDAIRVTGIGGDKVRALYHASIFDLPENPTFVDFADHLQDACELLASGGLPDFPSHGLELEDCCQVRNAFAAVGIGRPDLDCNGTPDVDVADDDSDGIPDALDNARLIPNPGQEDLDGDGVGDVADDDIDGDGIPNVVDNCPYVANPAQTDTDGNGIGDDCDDWDADGIINIDDNCDWDHNRGQADQDGDGIGDECDDDLDGDGVANRVDNCPYHANPGQEDPDNDGYGDIIGCDNCPGVYNPDQRDYPDNDGLGNACDPDDDNDEVADEADECPEVPGLEAWQFCAEGSVSAGLGCPCRRMISPGSWYMHFYKELFEGLREPGIEPISPASSKMINPCEFVLCEEEALFKEATGLQMELDLSLDLPEGAEMKAPVWIDLAVLDEAGNRVANDHAYFFVNSKQVQKEAKVDLSFDILPSFSWASVGAPPDQTKSFAAIPTYYLVVRTNFGNRENLDIMVDRRLLLKARISDKSVVRKQR